MKDAQFSEILLKALVDSLEKDSHEHLNSILKNTTFKLYSTKESLIVIIYPNVLKLHDVDPKEAVLFQIDPKARTVSGFTTIYDETSRVPDSETLARDIINLFFNTSDNPAESVKKVIDAKNSGENNDS